MARLNFGAGRSLSTMEGDEMLTAPEKLMQKLAMVEVQKVVMEFSRAK